MKKLLLATLFQFFMIPIAFGGTGTVLKFINGSSTTTANITYLGNYCMFDFGGNNSHPELINTTIAASESISAYIEAQGIGDGCGKPFSYTYFSVSFDNNVAGCFAYQVSGNGDQTVVQSMGIPNSPAATNATAGYGNLIILQSANLDNPNLFSITVTVSPASGTYSPQQATLMTGLCRTRAAQFIANGGNNPF